MAHKYTYLLKFRYSGCEYYNTLEGVSLSQVLNQFRKLRIEPHTLADIYLVRSHIGGAIYLSTAKLSRYLMK